PHGSPEDVRAEVRRRLEDFMPGGGFVFNPVHNIQGDVPTENLMAMWETLREYGVYSQ
ncbi:MAG: uroporphyrinogen decarboxylase family protein, partial [Anaerolineae bacterium]